ncbi:ABC transporter substrate-binding protein [Streptomyces sp. ODS28]|uniref:ABC transporter substrate-binding protein n=1 Tax=Streptomyces sp. ODS28 TaxID=3136688 RepID=UPI0031EED291
MSHRNRRLRNSATLLISLSLVAGCGAITGDSGEEDRALTVGTTSEPSTLDPAEAWDSSWELYKNTFQTLLHFPNSSTTPSPDAAQRCGFTDSDSQVYRCTLRKGLKFSNGNVLDSSAVKYSFDRTRRIKSATGPAGLFGSIDRVETPDKRTVVFHLNKPDATWPYILSTPAASIVDPKSYPADRVRKDNKLVGSGPYTLDSYEHGKDAVLRKNTSYKGAANVKNDSVTIRYYQDSDKMVAALRQKKIDVTVRGLTPKQITDLQSAEAKGDNSIDLSEMLGTEIRFLVFNPKDPEARKPAVRKAIAQLIDRKALVRKVYHHTADPLYSMVPGGITGHTSAFYDEYGDPSVSKARDTLSQGGVNGKVKLTLWYTTDRYGSQTAGEFQEIKRQLNGSGLFDVKVKGRPWREFQKGYSKGEYPVFGRGWFPDFPDADNYLASFAGKNNAVGTPYNNSTLTDKLLAPSRKESDRGVAGRYFSRAQKVVAQDARLLPLWQGRLYVASGKDMSGVEWMLDPSALPRLWELHKKAEW